MVKRDFIVKNKTGLDSKSTAMFIQIASAYKSSIFIQNGDRKANAKSLLGILSLGISDASKITITAEGEDEEIAISKLKQYLECNLGEN